MKLKAIITNPIGMFRRSSQEKRTATNGTPTFDADLYFAQQNRAEFDLLVAEVAYRQLKDELWMCQIAKQRMANPFTDVKSKQVHITEFNAESTYGLTFLWNKKFLTYKIKMLKSQLKMMKQDKIKAEDSLEEIKETIRQHRLNQRPQKKQIFLDMLRFAQQDEDLRSAYIEVDRNIKMYEEEKRRLYLGVKNLIGIEIPAELVSSNEKISWLDLKIEVSKKAQKFILKARREVKKQKELYMKKFGLKYKKM